MSTPPSSSLHINPDFLDELEEPGTTPQPIPQADLSRLTATDDNYHHPGLDDEVPLEPPHVDEGSHAQAQQRPAQPKKANNLKIYLIGGAIAVVLVTVVVGAGYSILFPSQGAQGALGAPTNADIQALQGHVQELPIDENFGLDAPVARAPAPIKQVAASTPASVPQAPITNSSAATPPAKEKEIVVTYSTQPSPSEASVTPLPGQTASEEEQMYDAALENMASINAPHSAIKIDQGEVVKALEAKKIDRIEDKVNKAAAEFSSYKGAVNKLQADFQAEETINAKRHEDLNQKLDAVMKKLDSTQSTTSDDVKQLKLAVSQLAKQVQDAPKKTVAASNNTRRDAEPTPKTKVNEVKSPIVQAAQQDVRPTQPKVFPVPTAQPRAIETAGYSDPSKPVMPSQCTGNSPVVSAVWRVKGVVKGAAYIVRPEDDYGLYLQMDADVPGFGSVKSFDTASRQVCTSKGLIRR